MKWDSSDPVQDDLWAFVSPPHRTSGPSVPEVDGASRAAEGMNLAENAVDLRWRAIAQKTIEDLAATGREFDAETVRDLIGGPTGSPSAIGALFRRAAREGLITHAGWRTASRPEAHCRPLRTWRGIT